MQNFKDKLYYDYSEVQNKNQGKYNKILEEEPCPYNLWCHISCIYWIPELYFEDEINCT